MRLLYLDIICILFSARSGGDIWPQMFQECKMYMLPGLNGYSESAEGMKLTKFLRVIECEKIVQGI